MPIYSIRNNDTGEVNDEIMTWSSLQELLSNNSNLESIITKAPGIISGTGGSLKLAGDGWKEVQQRIQSGLPPKDRGLIKTK
mgnify:CR=1 FL=1|jgi:hypothetical protein